MVFGLAAAFELSTLAGAVGDLKACADVIASVRVILISRTASPGLPKLGSCEPFLKNSTPPALDNES